MVCQASPRASSAGNLDSVWMLGCYLDCLLKSLGFIKLVKPQAGGQSVHMQNQTPHLGLGQIPRSSTAALQGP
jgi:hypothetical protein